jgi:hypothetical protein
MKDRWPVRTSQAINGRRGHRHTGFQIDIHTRFFDQTVPPPNNVSGWKSQHRAIAQRQRHVGFKRGNVAGGPELNWRMPQIHHVERELHECAADRRSSTMGPRLATPPSRQPQRRTPRRRRPMYPARQKYLFTRAARLVGLSWASRGARHPRSSSYSFKANI